MTKHVTLTDLYGAPALTLRIKGVSPKEIGKQLGIPDATRAKIVGIIHRQNTAVAKYNQDLAICAEIDAGLDDYAIAAAFQVDSRHVAGLRKELVALDGL